MVSLEFIFVTFRALDKIVNKLYNTRSQISRLGD